MTEAISELHDLIRNKYPEADFVNQYGEDPEGVYVTAVVDVEDVEEVYDLVADKLLQLQIDQLLPIYLSAVRPDQRIVEQLSERARRHDPRSGRPAFGP